jgi:hypothetical protein
MTDVTLMLKAMDDRHVDMCAVTQTKPHVLAIKRPVETIVSIPNNRERTPVNFM